MGCDPVSIVNHTRREGLNRKIRVRSAYEIYKTYTLSNEPDVHRLTPSDEEWDIIAREIAALK
jgi:hypothetical protein